MEGNEGKDDQIADDQVTDAGDVDLSADFDEFASKLEPAPADTAAAPTDQVDPDEEDEQPELPAPANAGATNEQAAPSGPAGGPSEDPWANVPAELKTQFDALQHQLNSTKGRLSVADRRIAELTTRAATDAATGQDGGDGTGEGRAAEKPASIRENPKVKQLLEDYGDVAGPLVDIIEQQQALIEQVARPVAEITADRNQQAVSEQFQLVQDRHPDLVTVVNDPRYVAWLDTQPRAVRDAYERNQTTVVDGHEAAWVLDQFKRDMGIKTATPTPSPTPSPTPTPTPSGPAADGKRQRQLDANRDGGGSGGAIQHDADPNDLTAQFDHFAAKAERRRKQALGSM